MQRRAAPLRFIAVRLAVPELESAARQPGVVEALRLTIQYHDGRHPDQIATLTKMSHPGEPVRLSVHYRRANDQALVLDYAIDAERFVAFNAALRKLGFDKLDDLPDIPWYGADLWLVERAAGSFHHDLIIAPDSASGTHAEIVKLIRENLREAGRAINP
jgi:hypothetical protein